MNFHQNLIRHHIKKMRTSFQNFLSQILTIFVFLFFENSVLANEVENPKFTLKEGSQFELCQEIKQILNEPENANFMGVYSRKILNIKNEFISSQFLIPKKYKNFKDPVWENIKFEDLSKYSLPNQLLNNFISLAKTNKTQIAQKTKLDLDHDGKNDEIIRFKVNDKRDSWHCFVSDINEQSIMSNSYNKSYLGDDCHLFSYKGKIFRATSSDTILFVHEPITGIAIGFGMKPVCTFNPK